MFLVTARVKSTRHTPSLPPRDDGGVQHDLVGPDDGALGDAGELHLGDELHGPDKDFETGHLVVLDFADPPASGRVAVGHDFGECPALAR
jgi:hypothetical protein